MATELTGLLALLSEGAAARVAAAAGSVAAIRLGARQHLCATLWSPDFAIACTDLLAERDGFLLLLDTGHAIGRVVWRDAISGLAGLQLDTPLPFQATPHPRETSPDALLIAIGVDDTGLQTARLVALEPPDGPFPAIEGVFGPSDFAGPLIAPSGARVGIVSPGPEGCLGPTRLIPHEEVARLVASGGRVHEPKAVPPAASPAPPGKAAAAAQNIEKIPASRFHLPSGGRRGWLGVGLQPIAVPRALRKLAGQNSGRRVIDIVPDGPADRAGLLSGDIVLTIAELSMVGAGAIRDFLAGTPIGESAEMILLRAGALIRLNITVRERPPD